MLKKLMEEKVSREEVPRLTSDKVSKEEIASLIPNEEIMQEKMKFVVRDEIEVMYGKFMDHLRNFDGKLVRLRQDVDVHSIQKQIERKANEDQVRNDFGNHEFKISTLDRNIVRMATDFETF